MSRCTCKHSESGPCDYCCAKIDNAESIAYLAREITSAIAAGARINIDTVSEYNDLLEVPND